MTRTFTLTLPRRLRLPGTGGGGRHVLTIAADEPCDALRLYRQEFPDGPEPDTITEV